MKDETKEKLIKIPFIVSGILICLFFVNYMYSYNTPVDDIKIIDDDYTTQTKTNTVKPYIKPKVEYPIISPETESLFDITDYKNITYQDTEMKWIKKIATQTYKNGTPDYVFINITGYEWVTTNRTKQRKTGIVQIYHKERNKHITLADSKYKIIQKNKNEIHYISPGKSTDMKCFVYADNKTCYRKGNTNSEELNQLFNPELVDADYPTYLYERKNI